MDDSVAIGFLIVVAVALWPGDSPMQHWDAAISEDKPPIIYVAPAGRCRDEWPGMFDFYPTCLRIAYGRLNGSGGTIQLLDGVY